MNVVSNIALQADALRLVVGDRTLLQDFSMSVASGSKTLITGASGSGKSTLLKCFIGLTPVTQGCIQVLGQTLTPHNVWTLRRQVAYVPQEPDLGAGLVRECIERPFQYRANAHLRGNPPHADAWFERFRLSRALMDKETRSLSGGEKQRVALIIAILLQRPIVLLDEPTSALDPKAADSVLAWLKDSDITSLIVAHHSGQFAFADQRIDLDGGQEATL